MKTRPRYIILTSKTLSTKTKQKLIEAWAQVDKTNVFIR